MRNINQPDAIGPDQAGNIGNVDEGLVHSAAHAEAILKPDWTELRDWVSEAEAVILCGVSQRTMNRRINAENWPFRERQGQGGGREYPVWMLPVPARQIVAKLNAHAALMMGGHAAYGAVNGLKYKLAQDMQRVRTRTKGQSLSARQHLDRRLDIIIACNTYRKSAGCMSLKGYEQFVALWNAGDIEAEADLKADYPELNARTLRRWADQLKSGGMDGLAPGYGARRGETLIDNDDEVKDLVLGLLSTTPHISVRLIMRSLRARFQDKPERLPSYRSVQRWVANWKAKNPALVTALMSPDAFRSKFGTAFGNAAETLSHVNARWEMDSTPTDVILADGKRHAIIGVIDVYSRRKKLLVSRTSKSTAIAALLRRALLDWGRPDLIKTDNGADYASQYIKRVMASLGIEQEFCPPFTPQAKPFIERALGTFSHGLLELFPQFIGHNVADRKAIENRKSFAQRLMKTGGEPVEIALTPDQLQDFCDRWCDDIYAHDPHKGLGNKTPFQVASECTHPIARITNERALDLLLSEAPSGGTRKVGKKGLAIEGANFNHPMLGGIEGQIVRVLYDETDVGRVHLFDADHGGFICTAICPERLGVSRSELAMAARAKQAADIAEKKRDLKAAARRSGAKDKTKLVQEILDHARSESSKLTAFPKRELIADSDDLIQAADAVEIIQFGRAKKPASLSEDDLAAVEEKLAEIDARAGRDGPVTDNVVSLSLVAKVSPASSDDRPVNADDRTWALWVINNPDRITSDDISWLLSNLSSRNFRMMLDLTDDQLSEIMNKWA